MLLLGWQDIVLVVSSSQGYLKRDLGGQINSRFMLRMIGSSEVVLPHLVVGTNVYKAENE